jgi:uncharacterized membrane protein
MITRGGGGIKPSLAIDDIAGDATAARGYAETWRGTMRIRAILLLTMALSLGMSCVAAMATGIDPRLGETAPAANDGILLRRMVYKTLSYQVFSSVNDFAFGYVFGGVVGGGLLVAANAASELVTNYAHDLTWVEATRGTGLSESDTRAARTLTYSAVSAVRVFGLGMMVTGSPAISLGYVVFNAAGDAGVYILNDIAWGHLWPVPPPAPRLVLQAPANP